MIRRKMSFHKSTLPRVPRMDRVLTVTLEYRVASGDMLTTDGIEQYMNELKVAALRRGFVESGPPMYETKLEGE